MCASSIGSDIPVLLGPGEDNDSVSSGDNESVESTDSTDESADNYCMQCYTCTDFGHGPEQCNLSAYCSLIEAEICVAEEARNNTFCQVGQSPQAA